MFSPSDRAAAPSQAAVSACEGIAVEDVAAARQAEYIAFLHRHPFATDAYELGFLPGVREDYSLQIDDSANVDVPILMVDNDFRDPDPERYVARIRNLDRAPWVCVLGDAATPQQAREYTSLANDLADEFPTTEFVIVPKCREAIEIVDARFVLGYPIGYSDVRHRISARSLIGVAGASTSSVPVHPSNSQRFSGSHSRRFRTTHPPISLVSTGTVHSALRISVNTGVVKAGKVLTTFLSELRFVRVSARYDGSGKNEECGRPNPRSKVLAQPFVNPTIPYSPEIVKTSEGVKRSKTQS